MAKNTSLDQLTTQKLTGLRLSLLRLHKVLLDDERASYEKAHGPIGSISQVLSLVMSDPWFDWLHTFSRQIVKIDDRTQARHGCS
jgi:hypothetical protein